MANHCGPRGVEKNVTWCYKRKVFQFRVVTVTGCITQPHHGWGFLITAHPAVFYSLHIHPSFNICQIKCSKLDQNKISSGLSHTPKCLYLKLSCLCHVSTILQPCYAKHCTLVLLAGLHREQADLSVTGLRSGPHCHEND